MPCRSPYRYKEIITAIIYQNAHFFRLPCRQNEIATVDTGWPPGLGVVEIIS